MSYCLSAIVAEKSAVTAPTVATAADPAGASAKSTPALAIR